MIMGDDPRPHGAEHLAKHCWQPGQSGNPAGRQKGHVTLTSMLRRDVLKDNHAAADAIIEATIRQAEGGNYQFVQMVLDRLDGPVAARVIVESELAHMLAVAKDVLPSEHYAALVAALAATPSSG